MEEKEKTVCLADSSGSDGSLSKDLPKRAEMNFSTTSLPLEIDVDENNGKDEKEDMTSVQSGRDVVPPEEEKVYCYFLYWHCARKVLPWGLRHSNKKLKYIQPVIG